MAALDRFAAGMTLDELARQLGCSRRTVQRILRRARIRLSDASG